MKASYANSWLSKKIRYRFILILFFLSTIFSSCEQTSNAEFSKEQAEKIKAFFQEFLLEHGAAYTLFGSKPVTVEDLNEFSDEKREQLGSYLAAHPEIEYVLVDRKLEEGWEEWKKSYHRPISKNYILREMELQNSRTLVFLNVPLTILTLKNYYPDFKEVIGNDFDPEGLVEQLRNGQEELWNRILCHYKTLGILAGYGYQNAKLFENQFKKELTITCPSENNDPRLEAECYLDNIPFRIPIFVMLDKNESEALVDKYKQEREKIKRYYQGKDFLHATFRQLNQK